MAKPRSKPKSKKVAGPHPLTRAGERNETKAMEAKESPAFERAEKRLGIEGRYSKKNLRGKKGGY